MIEKLDSIRNGRIKYALRCGKNILLQKLGLRRISTISLVLTDRCNLRCRMCDIWERSEGQRSELSKEKITQVLTVNDVKRVNFINFTGGEPFLREDIFEIYLLVRSLCPNCKIVISSNGTLTGEMIGFFVKIRSLRNIALELSILGIDRHDYVTRREDSFDSIKNTIEKLKQRFPSLSLRAKFTIAPWNYSEIEKVVDYCCERNILLSIKVIENVKSYTNSLRYDENIKKNHFDLSANEVRYILCALHRIKKSQVVDRYIIENISIFLREKQLKKRCYVSVRSLFVNSDGSIYRCRMREPIGNINNHQLNFMLEQSKNQINKSNGKNDFCQNCISIFRFLV